MLQLMPSFCSTSARAHAFQVDASLISTRSRLMPASSYSLMSSWPFAIERLGVEREARVHFGRHPARNDLQDLLCRTRSADGR